MTRLVRLAVGIATGIARDQAARRKAMFALTAAALVMIFAGVAILWNFFAAHPLFFALYWLTCAWLSVCAALMAIFDLLTLIRKGRREREAARKRIFGNSDETK